jgi:hypothetical protein
MTMTVEIKTVDLDELYERLRERVPMEQTKPITKDDAEAKGYRVVTVCADDIIKTKDRIG